ncbi:MULTISPECIES: hypothetical protein [Bacillus]|uniref:hypothetical protein n=1 Tax=Bacillus TaxID=1386 RepID=UPI0030C99DEE
MQKENRFEMFFLPSKKGMIRVFIYGFDAPGSWGQVFAQYHDYTINMKGYNKKKTIIQTLNKLNERLINENL